MTPVLLTATPMTDWIVRFIDSLNSGFNVCKTLLEANPLLEITDGGKLADFKEVVKASATSLFTLLFFLGFLEKTMDFHWVKIENVVLATAKWGVASALINNSDMLMLAISNEFSKIATACSVPLLGFLERDATIFLPTVAKIDKTPGAFNIYMTIEQLQLMPVFLILSIIVVLIQLIVLGRMFEIMIYTAIAPLPLATFASHSTADIGKSFLKNYSAVVLQGGILVGIFMVYGEMLPVLKNNLGGSLGNGFAQIALAGLLAMTVLKSGSWAQKICGA
jgi:hypothetical protein